MRPWRCCVCSRPTKSGRCFEHQPDPRLRSYLLDRLASHGADPESLWQRLTVEKDDSIRRALILGLGDFADAKLLSAAQQATISAELLRLYQEDPDPGIHGAAEWTLKQLGTAGGTGQRAIGAGHRRGCRPAPLVRDEARAAHDGDSGAAGAVPDGVAGLRGGKIRRSDGSL